MTSSYKLSFFHFGGRAEIVRLMFAYVGQKHEDNLVERENWPELKPHTPFGQMPMLEADGEKIAQSVAITNYIARKFGLYGKTNMESCMIDQVVSLIQDLKNARVKAMHEKDELKKAELTKMYTEELLPKFLGFFEKMLKQNGNGYFVGSDITLADLIVFDLTWSLVKDTSTFLDNYPLLKQSYNTVASIPNVKFYIESRQLTDK